MKTSRFSYIGDFARVADIGKVGNDFDEYSHYVILVGSPDYETSFLDSGEFIAAEPFTTYADAKRALSLTTRTLELVDKNLEQGLKLSDVRAEVLAAISRAFSRADEKGCAVSKQEVLRAADSVLGYYARNED